MIVLELTSTPPPTSSLAGSFFMLLYYLPIYFQSVDNVSASQSGVRNIPFVLGVSICTIISGGMISALGWYVPWLFVGSILATIGNGLLYTLDIGTSSPKWIGYQALTGIGLGFSVQVPMIANQAFVKVRDIPPVTAATLCKYPFLNPLPPYTNIIQSFKPSAAHSSSQQAKQHSPTGFSLVFHKMRLVSIQPRSSLPVLRI